MLYNSETDIYLWFDILCFDLVPNTYWRICLTILSVVNTWSVSVDGYGYKGLLWLVFAIACVVCRNVNQCFTCVLVTFVSTWYRITENMWFVLQRRFAHFFQDAYSRQRWVRVMWKVITNVCKSNYQNAITPTISFLLLVTVTHSFTCNLIKQKVCTF